MEGKLSNQFVDNITKVLKDFKGNADPKAIAKIVSDLFGKNTKEANKA